MAELDVRATGALMRRTPMANFPSVGVVPSAGHDHVKG